MQTPAVRVKKVSVKRVTKKVKTKPDLNSSRVKLKTVGTPSCKSYSFLNASLQKKTLRQNNSALAQALAKARQTLREANSENADLRTRNHEQTVELLRLKRVTELKDCEIENEVQIRMKDHMLQMKADLEELTHNMLASSSFISSLHDKCITFCRGSIGSSRTPSVDLSVLDDFSMPTQPRQKRGECLERNPRPLSFTLRTSRTKVDDFSPMSISDVDPDDESSNHDLSMITEQSFLGKECTELLQIPTLDAVSENECLVQPLETMDSAEPLTTSHKINNEFKDKDNRADIDVDITDLSTLSASLSGIMDELMSGSPISIPATIDSVPSTEKEPETRRETIVLDIPVILVTDDKQESDLEKGNNKKDVGKPKDPSSIKPRSKSDKKSNKTATTTSTTKGNTSLFNKKKLPVPVATSKSSASIVVTSKSSASIVATSKSSASIVATSKSSASIVATSKSSTSLVTTSKSSTSQKISDLKSKDRSTYSVDRTTTEVANDIVNEPFNPFKPFKTLIRSPPSQHNSPQQAVMDEQALKIDSTKFLTNLRLSANKQTSGTETVETNKTEKSDESNAITSAKPDRKQKSSVSSNKMENESSKNQSNETGTVEATVAHSDMDKTQPKPLDHGAGEHIYELPMPKGSPEERPAKSRRGRSKSGTRSKSETRSRSVTRSQSKSRKSGDSDEEDCNPSRSRSKSVTRGRSRSRKVVDSGNEEQNPTETRSRSRVRKNIDVEVGEEKNCEMVKSNSDVEIGNLGNQAALRRSARSKSHVRVIAISGSENNTTAESHETAESIPLEHEAVGRKTTEANCLVAPKDSSDNDFTNGRIENKTTTAHTFAKPLDVNPFKPSKTLLRSPPFRNNMSEPKETNGAADKIDGHMFLAHLRRSEDVQLNEYSFADEPTQYFDSNMELTCALDTISMSKNSHLSPALASIASMTKSSGSNNIEKEKKIKATKTAVTDNKDKKTGDERSKVKEKKKQLKEMDKEKVTEKDNGADTDDSSAVGAAVEMRANKPGNFTFAVSRKESDGTRKPVPDKVSRARSKKKKIVTPEKDVISSEEDKDVFNFGDRTPTMPLDKIQKVTAIYDLSMNESVQIPPIRLNNFRDKLNGTEDNVAVNSIKVNNKKQVEKRKQVLRPGECIYEMPMPNNSPEIQPSKSKRGRSKSGTRSKSQKSDDSDDEYVPYRSRSRSRKVLEPSDNEQYHRRSRSRSRSQARKNCKETEKNNVESVDRSTRSKSRSRKDNSSDEETSPPPVKKPSRSRARLVIESDTDESITTTEAEQLETPKVTMSNVDNSRAKAVERESKNSSVETHVDTENVNTYAGNKGSTDDVHLYHLPLKGSPETLKEHNERKSRSKGQLQTNTDGDKLKSSKKARSKSVGRKSTKVASDDELDTERVSETSKKSNVRKSVKKSHNIVIEDSDSDFESHDHSLKSRRKSRRKQQKVAEPDISDICNNSVVVLQRLLDDDISSSATVSPMDSKQSKTAKANQHFSSDVLESKSNTQESESDINSASNVHEFKFVTNSRGRSRECTITKNNSKAKNTEKEINIEESSSNDNQPHVQSPVLKKSVPLSKSMKKKPPSSSKVQASTKSAKKRKPLTDVTMETPIYINIEKQTSKSTKKQKLVEKLDKADDAMEKMGDTVDRRSTKTPATGKARSKSGTTGKSSKVKTEKSSRKRKVPQAPHEDDTPRKIEINFVDKPGVDKENSSLANIRRRLNALKQRTSTEVAQREPCSSTKRDVNEFTNDGATDVLFEGDSDQAGKRIRRAKAPVSYVELRLNAKLRQGDQLFKANSPISRAKAEKARLMLGQRMSILGGALNKGHE